MITYDKESEEYKRAKMRVDEVRGFWSHLAVYIIVNLGIFIVNMLTTPHQLWFYWSLLGWGIGLLAHGFHVFCAQGIFGKDWEERQIKKYMDKKDQ